jgi:aspartate 1-decarboxylase
MLITILKSKLHHARVTESELEYQGSLTIDPDLMDEVRLHSYEKILVANMANGERLETYAIPGERGSKTICLNGATAHKGSVGDRLIIFAFAQIEEEDAASHKPQVIVLDENNDIITL